MVEGFISKLAASLTLHQFRESKNYKSMTIALDSVQDDVSKILL